MSEKEEFHQSNFNLDYKNIETNQSKKQNEFLTSENEQKLSSIIAAFEHIINQPKLLPEFYKHFMSEFKDEDLYYKSSSKISIFAKIIFKMANSYPNDLETHKFLILILEKLTLSNDSELIYLLSQENYLNFLAFNFSSIPFSVISITNNISETESEPNMRILQFMLPIIQPFFSTIMNSPPQLNHHKLIVAFIFNITKHLQTDPNIIRFLINFYKQYFLFPVLHSDYSISCIFLNSLYNFISYSQISCFEIGIQDPKIIHYLKENVLHIWKNPNIDKRDNQQITQIVWYSLWLLKTFTFEFSNNNKFVSSEMTNKLPPDEYLIDVENVIELFNQFQEPNIKSLLLSYLITLSSSNDEIAMRCKENINNLYQIINVNEHHAILIDVLTLIVIGAAFMNNTELISFYRESPIWKSILEYFAEDPGLNQFVFLTIGLIGTVLKAAIETGDSLKIRSQLEETGAINVLINISESDFSYINQAASQILNNLQQ